MDLTTTTTKNGLFREEMVMSGFIEGPTSELKVTFVVNQISGCLSGHADGWSTVRI